MRTAEYWIGFVLMLVLGCDQQASIGERSDAGADVDAAAPTHGLDGSVTCDRPTCGNYVFPPSPRLARVVERSAGGSSRTLLDLEYNAMGEIVSDRASSVITKLYTYEEGRLVKIESLRDGVQGGETTLSWQGDRLLGSEGWSDERVLFNDPDPEGWEPVHYSEMRTYGALGAESIEFRYTNATGNSSTSLRSIMYGETGTIDRWRLTSNGDRDAGGGELFYTSGQISRIRTTRTYSPGDEQVYETQLMYDENGRLASAHVSGNTVSTMTYNYFYNASGLISRIESQRDGRPAATLELTYETGTTPSVQFHHGWMVTLRGEVTPVPGFTSYPISIDFDTSWL